jgi:hypothetical protein
MVVPPKPGLSVTLNTPLDGKESSPAGGKGPGTAVATQLQQIISINNTMRTRLAAESPRVLQLFLPESFMVFSCE